MTANPLLGDRAAWDVTNFPSRHSSDLSTSTPIYHVPLPGNAGNMLVSDGTKWVSGAGSSLVPPIMTLGTYEGSLEIGETPLKIYNKYGASRNITEVFLSVGTAPTGDDIIVDVLIDDVSIFYVDEYTDERPTILAGETTGTTTTITYPTWLDDSYLTWEIIQVGSGSAGSNLVVHIVHGADVYGSGS